MKQKKTKKKLKILSRFYKGDKCSQCKRDVTIKNKSGKCRSCRMLGTQYGLGHKKNLKARRHLSKIRKGEKNPNWKGEKAGYNAIHRWIEARLKKPNLCKECFLRSPYDLANISGEYKRDINDFEWLCRICHMTKDGRIKNLRQYAKEKKKTHSISAKEKVRLRILSLD